MRLARTCAALAALTGVLAVAAPASALLSAGASAACGYSQTCSGTAQDVPTIGSGSDVQATCSATTPYAVQATVVQCYIRGNLGDRHFTDAVLTQGRASSLTWDFPAWSLTSRSYIVCVGAGYFDGVYRAPANFACNPGI